MNAETIPGLSRTFTAVLDTILRLQSLDEEAVWSWAIIMMNNVEIGRGGEWSPE